MTPGRHVDGTVPADGPSRNSGEQGSRDPEDDGSRGRGQREASTAGAEEPPTAQRRDRTSTGPVLPNRSKSDTDAAWGDARRDRDDDERFLREVPPHW